MGKLKQCFNQMLALHKAYIYTNRFDFFFIQAIYIHIYIYTQHMHFYVYIYIYIYVCIYIYKILIYVIHIRSFLGDFPGSPLVKNPHFKCRGHRFNPWLGTNIPLAI